MGIIAPEHKKEQVWIIINNKETIMCGPTQEKMSTFRDTLRDILEQYKQTGDNGTEEAVIAIISAARLVFTVEQDTPVRKGNLNAMLAGLTRSQSIKTQCYNRFRMNYNWSTKNGQNLLEFLASVPENQTIDKFADWYWKNDWRGQRKTPPSLVDIYTLWPQAFDCPEYGLPKPPVFHVSVE